MRCFIHQDKEAIAICRSCAKGLCLECSVDVGRGLACKSGVCEQVARDYIEILDRNIQASKQNVGAVSIIQSKQGASVASIDHLTFKVAIQEKMTRRMAIGNSIFYFIVGFLFLIWAISDFNKYSFALIFAACFIIFWGNSFKASLRG